MLRLLSLSKQRRFTSTGSVTDLYRLSDRFDCASMNSETGVNELEVSGETGCEGVFRNGKAWLEYTEAAVLGGWGPVADNLAVKGDYGQEYSVVAVGLVGMLGRKDDITALVADEIFIIRRD